MGYIFGKKIGEGTYSKVRIALYLKDGIQTTLACKIINKQSAGSDFIKKFLPRELK